MNTTTHIRQFLLAGALLFVGFVGYSVLLKPIPADQATNSSAGAVLGVGGSVGTDGLGGSTDPGKEPTYCVYVADFQNNRIEKFTENGDYITQWGTYGTGSGQFYFPNSLAQDSFGYIYVSEMLNRRVQKFTAEGGYVTMWGSHGHGNSQFSSIGSMTIDRNNNIYVHDKLDHSIRKFTSTGDFLLKWGSQGFGNGQFSVSHGIAHDSASNIHLADSLNDRIEIFSSIGLYLAQWGVQGSALGHLDRPHAIALDSHDNVYIADSQSNRIQKFTQSGTYLYSWGSAGSGDGEFNFVSNFAIDPLDRIYVIDQTNFRIQKFNSSGTFLTKWGSMGSGNGQFMDQTYGIVAGLCKTLPAPDLVVTNITIRNQPIHVSSTDPFIQYDATVQNIGNAPVTLESTGPNAFQLSLTTIPTTVVSGDLSNVSLGSPVTLQPGQSYIFANMSTRYDSAIRRTARTYTITAKADSAQIINESNDGNNTLATSLTIVP